LVREIVKAEPDLTIPEVGWEFHRRTGRSVSPAAMGRTLRKLGLTGIMERWRLESASDRPRRHRRGGAHGDAWSVATPGAARP
jgi:hypothetical protein